ncbi:5-oxoprolinase subunit PxpA [Candidatus Bathyarchaeota archaeon]|nr:5-oxoprolinase subunit PxpA [Candidatus Bathyarchaeota archaeon]
MKFQVDINCDLGENYGAFKVGNDEKIMPHITSANIACGFHAGDPVTIMQTVNMAKKHGVAVGAHPGYPDLLGFGRREMQLTMEEIKSYMIYQISALQGFAKTVNVKLQHVKPHGALYNTAAKDTNVSESIAEAVKMLDPKLIVFAPPKSALAKAVVKAGLRVAHEVFADRTYNSDGSLVSRKQPDAIIQEPKRVVERAVRMVREGIVVAVNSEIVKLGEVHTICVHGDTPTAVELVKRLKKGLIKAAIRVKPVSSFV